MRSSVAIERTTRQRRRSASRESDQGYVEGVSGPVVTARRMRACAMYELVRVGHSRMLGEVIRLEADRATVQVYEDTSGLAAGDPVERTGRPLAVELAPGLLGSIFDGIQRPLRDVHLATGSIYMGRGLDLPAVSRTAYWEFCPLPRLKRGQPLTGGDLVGLVYENKLLKHRIMVAPDTCGRLKYLAPAGSYTVDEVILQLEYEDRTIDQSMLQIWPVRRARPYADKMRPRRPIVTGQRVLDGLFPCAQGATCALPGAFGCGKTGLSQALAKYSNSDVVVYVGCGERGNEMAELLRDFPKLRVEVDGASESIMKRSVLVANASNMPVAAREASIYTGVSIAEYFRDQGQNVALLADSTSRWAEALREISGRLGEMPADQGYPAYLNARLANFYERAGRVRCRGSPRREGSVSIVGVVSPPGGDMADPVTSATLGVVQTYWALDKKLAERKHFPAINWSLSYSKSIEPLTHYYDANFPEFVELRRKILEMLQREHELEKLTQIIGPTSLSEPEKLLLAVVRMLTEDFLQQNAQSSQDRFCPFYKTLGMMRNLVRFYELGLRAIETRQGHKDDDEPAMTWARIRTKLADTIDRLAIMKYLCPVHDGERVIVEELRELARVIEKAFEDI
ncbi:hypothetical protein TKK_0012076 [Trichogramma kaykai]